MEKKPISKYSRSKARRMASTPGSRDQKLIKLGEICCNVCSPLHLGSSLILMRVLDNNIRVSEEWVHRWEREHEAVKLPDGGYLGMLSVFHELHCIVSSIFHPLEKFKRLIKNTRNVSIKPCPQITTTRMQPKKKSRRTESTTVSLMLNLEDGVQDCTRNMY